MTVFHIIPINGTSTKQRTSQAWVQRRAFVLDSWWRRWCDVRGGCRHRLRLVRDGFCMWIRTTCAWVMGKQKRGKEGDGVAMRPEQQGDGEAAAELDWV